MSLIEKIDELEKHLIKNDCYFEGAEWVFGKVREAILSEQKEPCKGCQHYGNYENEVEYGYPSPCTQCKRRCSDNYLSQPYTDSKIN